MCRCRPIPEDPKQGTLENMKSVEHDKNEGSASIQSSESANLNQREFECQHQQLIITENELVGCDIDISIYIYI